MPTRKKRKCAKCNNDFLPYKIGQNYCSPGCYYSSKPKTKTGPIPKVSKKRQKENPIYKERSKIFLNDPKNAICFIDGCNKQSTTIEHRMGRKGYADDWARDNKITLFLDERFWAGCCWAHNTELENNSELSKQYQLSKIHGGKKI